MIAGIDVSNNNNISDFALVRKTNDILIQKATEGITFVDKLLNYRYGQAKKYGFKFGVYHFAHNRNGVDEAKFFCNTIKGYKLDLYPVLDIEVETNWTKSRAIEYINQFNSYIQKVYGFLPAVYTGYSFYNDYLKGNIPNSILWIASYGKQPSTYPQHSWQYTGNGTLPGVVGQIDRNYFNENILMKKIIQPKPQPKPEEVNFDMDKIVIYFGDADVFASVIVAQKFGCPMMRKSDFEASGLKAKEIIQIGGKPEDKTRFDSFKNAAKLL